MKVNGKTLDNSKALFGPVVVVRGQTKIGFYAQPVWSFEEFNELCPRPKAPPTGWSPSGKKEGGDPKSPKFKEEIELYNRRKWGWMVLKSLEPSKLELDGITLDDPNGWEHVDSKLQFSKDNPDGLSHFEFAEVMELVDQANMMDAAKLEENRESFLSETTSQSGDVEGTSPN